MEKEDFFKKFKEQEEAKNAQAQDASAKSREQGAEITNLHNELIKHYQKVLHKSLKSFAKKLNDLKLKTTVPEPLPVTADYRIKPAKFIISIDINNRIKHVKTLEIEISPDNQDKKTNVIVSLLNVHGGKLVGGNYPSIKPFSGTTVEITSDELETYLDEVLSDLLIEK